MQNIPNIIIPLICPKCKVSLTSHSRELKCNNCGQVYPIIKGIPSFIKTEGSFYNNLYKTQLGARWSKGFLKAKNPVINIIKEVRLQISIIGKRHRFFKRVFGKEKDRLILDLGCGGGYELFTQYGNVVGIDLELAPLQTAKNIYSMVVHGDVTKLPFEDNTFDYAVSADLIGHIPSKDKDKLFSEIYRVLKQNGKTANVIETDSKNCLFRFAHKHPDLFQKHFVEDIGGHFGLEMPSEVIKRFVNHNFNLITADKLWGPIWPVEEYVERFDNEYRKKSKVINVLVLFTKFLTSNILFREITNIFLNIINCAVEKLTPIEHGQGLLIICTKGIKCDDKKM